VLGGKIGGNVLVDSEIRGNTVERMGMTAIGLYRSHRTNIIGNLVQDNYGVHANGLTVYVNSSHILIARNRVYRGNVGLTLQRSNHITVAYNVIHAPRTPAIADWDTLDHLKFYNNTVVGGTTGLTTGKNSRNITLKNNLVWPTSSAERSAGPFSISHNLYGKMPWPKKTKGLHQGEAVVAEKEKLFRDFDRQDFRPPAADFPGKDQGVAIPAEELGVDQDVTGKPVPAHGVDLGAYQ